MHWALWLAPAALLVLALLPLPYGYYTFLRLAVSLSAALIASWSWKRGALWSVMFAALAILFNPIAPVHLDRSTWAPIDLIAAALYVAHWRTLGRKPEQMT